MKTLITIIMAVATLFVSAADNEPASAFNSELAIETFGRVTTKDLDQGRLDGGVGVSYYLTRNFGAEVSTSFDELNGHTFESVSPRLLWRVPVGGPHAFYAFAQGTRTFHGDTGWSAEAGPGYEYRPFKHFGFFVEIGMSKELTGAKRSTDTFGTGVVGTRIIW